MGEGGNEKPGKVFDLDDWRKKTGKAENSVASSMNPIDEAGLNKLPQEEKLRILTEQYISEARDFIEKIDSDYFTDMNAINNAVDRVAVLFIACNDLLPGDEIVNRGPLDAITASRDRFKNRHS